MSDPLWQEALDLLAASSPPEASSLWQMNSSNLDTLRSLCHGTDDFLRHITGRHWFTTPRRLDDPHFETVSRLWMTILGEPEVSESPFVNLETLYPSYGKVVSTALLYQIYCARRIDQVSPTSILEIGAGYGGLARVLQMKRPRLYTIVDLPSSLFCSWLFLRRNFPEAGFIWGNKVVAAGAPQVFEFLPAGSPLIDRQFDIAINTNSLGEMLPIQAGQYLGLISRAARHFYSHNRHGERAPGLPDDCVSHIVPTLLGVGWEILFDEINGVGQVDPDMPPSRELLLRRRGIV